MLTILEIPDGSRPTFWGLFLQDPEGEGTWGKFLPWGWYGYFLALHNFIIGKKSTYPRHVVEIQGYLSLLVHQKSAKAMRSYFTNMNHKIMH